mmetsp:Transcript_91909/g.233729  ORF Transcript_91909/g.233729 Transcript_91909/m.233729 type:complete len:217 (-) Transcript_91909:18-668(-)
MDMHLALPHTTCEEALPKCARGRITVRAQPGQMEGPTMGAENFSGPRANARAPLLSHEHAKPRPSEDGSPQLPHGDTHARGEQAPEEAERAQAAREPARACAVGGARRARGGPVHRPKALGKNKLCIKPPPGRHGSTRRHSQAPRGARSSGPAPPGEKSAPRMPSAPSCWRTRLRPPASSTRSGRGSWASQCRCGPRSRRRPRSSRAPRSSGRRVA